MRRGGRRNVWAGIAIVAGFVILLSILLPGEFWWLMLAIGLIALGVWLLRCC